MKVTNLTFLASTLLLLLGVAKASPVTLSLYEDCTSPVETAAAIEQRSNCPSGF